MRRIPAILLHPSAIVLAFILLGSALAFTIQTGEGIYMVIGLVYFAIHIFLIFGYCGKKWK